MHPAHDPAAPKQPVRLMLNSDLVRRAEELGGDLSERVERLLADAVAAERERRLDDVIRAWNEFDRKHGSFADQYNDFL